MIINDEVNYYLSLEENYKILEQLLIDSKPFGPNDIKGNTSRRQAQKLLEEKVQPVVEDILGMKIRTPRVRIMGGNKLWDFMKITPPHLVRGTIMTSPLWTLFPLHAWPIPVGVAVLHGLYHSTLMFGGSLQGWPLFDPFVRNRIYSPQLNEETMIRALAHELTHKAQFQTDFSLMYRIRIIPRRLMIEGTAEWVRYEVEERFGMEHQLQQKQLSRAYLYLAENHGFEKRVTVDRLDIDFDMGVSALGYAAAAIITHKNGPEAIGQIVRGLPITLLKPDVDIPYDIKNLMPYLRLSETA